MRNLVLLAVVAVGGHFAAAAENSPSRVEVSLTVRGELFGPGSDESPAVREPIDVRAAFDFMETPDDAPRAAVVRQYRRATAAIQVGERTTRSTLAADAREVIVELAGMTPTPSLPQGFLSRQEADLLDTPCDVMLLPRIMPESAVARGETWKVPADVVAGLLAIDTVGEGGIDATLAAITDEVATLELSGTVSGAVDGMATRITVKGTALAACVAADDEGSWRITGPIQQFDGTLGEQREAGWVAPGLDIEATISVRRGEVPTDVAWTEKHRLDPPPAGRPSGQGRAGTVWHRHPHGRYTLVLDQRWRVVEDGADGLVMRLVDRGALVAQCSILPLPRTASEKPTSVEQVSRDVEASLGEQFGHIATAEESTRDDGTRVVRVMAEGTAEGRPFRWIHQLLTDQEGHRLAVTCMLEPAMADRFGGADLELAAGIVLLDSKAVSGDTSGLRSGRIPAEGRKLSR